VDAIVDNLRVTIERASPDEGIFKEVLALCLGLYRDNGIAPLNTQKLARHTFDVIAQGMTFITRVDGQAVGVLGLVEVGYSYSDETYLKDAGIWLMPEHRKGRAFEMLLAAARAEAEKRGKVLKIYFTNPDRAAKRRGRVVEGEILGFVPAGYAMRFGG
jgi:hypothetical protein